MELINTKNLPRQEWLEERRKGIGGSDAAAVCGLSKWKTPFDVWLDKTKRTPEQEDNEFTEWGKLLEPVILSKFEEKMACKVVNREAFIIHPDYPWMRATIDGQIFGKEEGVDAKNTGEYCAGDWDDGAPEYHIPQGLHYMAVTGFKKWHFAVLIGGNKFRIQTVERDEAAIKALIAIEKAFWEENVLKDIPPVLDGKTSAEEYLKKLYPTGKPEIVNLPPDATEWIRQYKEADKALKEADELKKQAQFNLQNMLGQYETGQIGKWDVKWKTQSRAGYYVKETTFRKFSIREVKAK